MAALFLLAGWRMVAAETASGDANAALLDDLLSPSRSADAPPAAVKRDTVAADTEPEPANEPPVTGEARASSPTPVPRQHVIEEIVVTATRRSESIQDVPLAVTAFGAEELERRKMTSLDEIQHAVPGFTYNQQVGYGQPTVRGVGSDIPTLAGEPGVAMYVDDVYIGRAFVSNATMTEVERVEVLRGPQGTLYGRNTSGGAVKFVTKRPTDELTASAGLQYGSFDQKVGRLSVAGPVVREWLNGRVSIRGEDTDGWLRNRTTGSLLRGIESVSVRMSAQAFPTDWLTIDLAGLYQDQEAGDPVERALGPVLSDAIGSSAALPIFAPADEFLSAIEQAGGENLDEVRQQLTQELGQSRTTDDPNAAYLSIDSVDRVELTGGSLTAQARLGFADSKLVVAQRTSDRLYVHDADGGEVHFLAANPSTHGGDQWSVEYHMTSATAGAFQWITGVFYYTEDAFETFNIEIGEPVNGEPPARLLFDKTQDTESKAVFGQADWDALGWLTLHGGGRFTLDEKVTDVFLDQAGATQECTMKGDWDEFTARLGLDLHLAEDILAYSSFAQGFKAGGFNSNGCDNRFEPELVDAWEVGLKSEWLGGLLRANLAGFYYTFDDIQVTQIDPGLVITIVNAAEAEIKGAELELYALPTERASVDVGLALLDAEYTSFLSDDPFTAAEGPIQLAGNRLNRSPEITFNLGVQYDFAPVSFVEIVPRVDWIYTSEQFFSQFNRHPAARRANHLVNAFVNFDVPAWGAGLQLFGKNLANERVVEWAAEAQPVGGTVGAHIRPRIFGVELYVAF